MNYRQFPILFLFLFLIFLNDGLSHPQVKNGPKFYIPAEGARYEWVTADDVLANDHPTVDSKVKADKSNLPLGKKWSLIVNGSSFVEAKMTRIAVIIDDVVILVPYAPDSNYLLLTQIKRKNAEGGFDTMFTGNKDTGWYVNQPGPSDLTSNVFASHICKNKFDLGDYQVEAKADITNTKANPDENAEASIAW